MKPNKEQLIILSELEMWAKKFKKETVRWEKEVNTVFRKEIREGYSEPEDVRFSLHYDVNFALEKLLDYIGTTKDDWEDL